MKYENLNIVCVKWETRVYTVNCDPAPPILLPHPAPIQDTSGIDKQDIFYSVSYETAHHIWVSYFRFSSYEQYFMYLNPMVSIRM